MSKRKSQERPTRHAGSRITFWYDPAEHLDEPENKTISRLKSKAKNPQDYGPSSNSVRQGDVNVHVKHWLGRMGRHENAH